MFILHKRSSGFTIIELVVVIAVIGILAAITVVGYGAWRDSVAETAVKSDLNAIAGAMESARNFGIGYPTTLPSGYTESAGVETPTIVTSSSQDFYCASTQSVEHASIQFRITSLISEPVSGTCEVYEGLTIASGLAAWWPFAGNANDYSGQNNNGTVYNATLTTGQGGQANSAYSFNGSTSYIEVGVSNSVGNLVKSLTMSVWVNVSNVTGNKGIFSALRVNSNNGLSLAQIGAALRFTTLGVKDYNSTTITLSPNTWYHFVSVMNSDNSTTYYINGVLSETVTHTASANPNLDDTAYIGSSNEFGTTSLSGPFQGTIDDLRVYSKELTSEQVSALYSAGAL